MSAKVLEATVWENFPEIQVNFEQGPLRDNAFTSKGSLSSCDFKLTGPGRAILVQRALLMYFKPQQGGGGLIHPQGGAAWAPCPIRME